MTVRLPTDANGLPIQVLGLGLNLAVPITSGPLAWGPAKDDVIVILCPTVDCHVEISPNAEATQKSTRLPANIWLPVKILPTHRISVVWAGIDEGVLDITETT